MKKFVTSVQIKSTGNLSTILFLIFLVSKLTGLIDWSWWWVTSPIWIPLVFGLALFIIILLTTIFKVLQNKDRNDII